MEIIHKHFNTIDSTNNWAKKNAHEFDVKKMTLITADMQSAGRGRFNRTWVSPPHQNIYASFCFAIDKQRKDIGNLPQIMAISTALTLEKLEFKPKLKWPNDVLLDGKKVAGILSETTPFEDILWMIIGIGVNVNMPKELLQQIDRPAASLFSESHKEWDVDSVLTLLQEQFNKDLSLFLKDGFPSFLESYKVRMAHQKGDKIRFHDNMAIREGFFQEINDDGTLSLLLADSELKTFVSGEILF